MLRQDVIWGITFSFLEKWQRNNIQKKKKSGSSKNLPEWGFKQYEITCKKRDTQESSLIWNVEMHFNEKRWFLFYFIFYFFQKKKKKTLKINFVPPSTESIPKNSFLTDFVHLNFVMVYTNNALIPDPKKVWH